MGFFMGKVKLFSWKAIDIPAILWYDVFCRCGLQLNLSDSVAKCMGRENSTSYPA